MFEGVTNGREEGAAEAGERDRRRTTARARSLIQDGANRLGEPPRGAPSSVRSPERETEQEQERTKQREKQSRFEPL